MVRINGPDHRMVFYLKELFLFRQTVERELKAAAAVLSTVDRDLLEALRKISIALGVLTDSAASALLSHTDIAQKVGSRVLLDLLEVLSTQRTARPGLVELVGNVQALTAELVRESAQVRQRYVLLLQDVRYVYSVAQLVEDGLYIEQSGEECDISSLALAERQSKMEALDTALMHLATVGHALEECSEVWLVLHSTEQMLASADQTAQQLKGELALGPGFVEPPHGLHALSECLERLCGQYARCHAQARKVAW